MRVRVRVRDDAVCGEQGEGRGVRVRVRDEGEG